MNDETHVPEEWPPMEELEGNLRQAVEKVRAETVPQVAVDRALVRAAVTVSSTPTRWRMQRKAQFAAIGIAASLLAAALLTTMWGSSGGTSEDRTPATPDIMVGLGDG